MTAEDFAARLTLLILLGIALLCVLGAFLYCLIGFLWCRWQIYWYGHRTHVSGLQKFRDLWPGQSAADTNLPSINGHSPAAGTNLPSINGHFSAAGTNLPSVNGHSPAAGTNLPSINGHFSAAGTNLPSINGHSSAEQSRKLYWRVKVWENLSGRKAGASGREVWQDSVIKPPMPAATTDSRQYVGNMV